MDRLGPISVVNDSIFAPLMKLHAAVALNETQDRAMSHILDSSFIGFSMLRNINKAAPYSPFWVFRN
ncbi:hypothetical protein D9M71_838170 [compost metagenome]